MHTFFFLILALYAAPQFSLCLKQAVSSPVCLMTHTLRNIGEDTENKLL